MSSNLVIGLLHVLLLLGSTVVIKEAEAQRPLQFIFHRIHDWLANFRPLGNQPSITSTASWPIIQEPSDVDFNNVEADVEPTLQVSSTVGKLGNKNK